MEGLNKTKNGLFQDQAKVANTTEGGKGAMQQPGMMMLAR